MFINKSKYLEKKIFTILLLIASLINIETVQAAMIDTITSIGDNTGSDNIQVRILAEDQISGSIKFTLEIVPSPNIADLRGFFADINDESLLPGLSVSDPQITSSDFTANAVGNFGGGVNVNPAKNFDLGLVIGTPGIGKDDFQSTMFELKHNTQSIDVSLFSDQRFGIRATSTGLPGSSRNGSSKVVTMFPEDPGTDPGTDPIPTPEPGTMALIGLGFGALGIYHRRKKCSL